MCCWSGIMEGGRAMGVERGVGMLKPSRSEGASSLSAEEQAKIAQQVQEFLAATAPHRSLKPSRSETESLLDQCPIDVPPDVVDQQLKRFEELEANPELLHTKGGIVNDDSYVETFYYDGLNSVDKTLHHETGSGFIKRGYGGISFSVGDTPEKLSRRGNKTNPATNEWEPSPNEVKQAEPTILRSESMGN